ncbi:unnamed protein product [Rotaria sp. Silwood1]|nr:unnamed protein product [Rotaria sp. Silwood1]CAF4659261.1 unnamed protein product [Rotaria sp. Silwood1]CAF5144730.1 unnamed protein product [Rotaria sp. Silwood1]
MSKKELDNDNTSLDSVNDSRINSFEDLEDKYLRECEQGHYSPTLVNINDRDLKITHLCADIADDCDQLEQQGESVINYDFVTTDVEDTFEGFTRTMDSLTTDDSLINTDLSQDVQYL